MTSIAKTKPEANSGLFGHCSGGQLADWVAQLPADPIVADVIDSAPFRRLKRISFLGALDHVAPTRKLSRRLRSRAEHSLNVAALASFVSQHRGYDEDLRRHLVIAGLLHDIGHPPLSHSVEPYLKKRFGYGHHEMGEMLITGRHKAGLSLKKTLMKAVDTGFIGDLIDGKANADVGGDLFSSAINIDTIDGIIRSYRYLSDSPTTLEPLQVAMASFLADSNERFAILDKFWSLKGFIYNNLITRDIGLIADQYSQVYLADTKQSLNEHDLFDSEQQWARKYRKLFSGLSAIKTIADAPDELNNVTMEYKLRRYTIKRDRFDKQRYLCVKEPVKQTLSKMAKRLGGFKRQLILSI